MSYCRSCGAAAGGGAFCRACGAATGAKTASDHTQPVARTQDLPAVSAGAADGGRPQQRAASRAPLWIALAAGVLALGAVIALIVVLLGGSGGSEGEARPVRHTLPKTGGTATSSTTTTTAPDLVRPAMLEIERLLIDSGTARKTLNDTILGPFQDCELDGSVAYDQMDAIIANRTRIRDAAAVLAQDADPTVRDLGAKLQAALQASLDSNYKYQTWMGEYRYYSFCPSLEDPMRQAANADSSRATTAKQVFVNTYNPIAFDYGMRTWTDAEI